MKLLVAADFVTVKLLQFFDYFSALYIVKQIEISYNNGTGRELSACSSKRLNTMSNLEPDASLQVPIYLENDFDVDDDGISYLVTSLFVGDEEEAQEVRIPLDDVVESLTEFYGDVEGFRHLYLVAHELSRAAEALREKAGLIEDSVSAVNDLFSLADD